MEYLKKAKEFLIKYELTLSIREAIPQKKPLWVKDSRKEVYGKNYFCSLLNRKTQKHYSFDYWGSVNMLNKNTNPNAYDILACLNTYDDGDSFEDFCNTYGYDIDSIIAEKTYTAVMKQIKELKEILSDKALNELNQIQ